MMPTITIQLNVDPQTARAFHEASEEDRRRVELVLALHLKTFFTPDRHSLLEIIDRMGREATANGMTPEILQSILDDEE